MIHDLRNEKVLLIEPAFYETKCKQLDEFNFDAWLASNNTLARVDPNHPRAEFTHDLYGQPIPRPQYVDGVAIIPIKGVLLGDCPDIYELFGFCNAAKILNWIQEAAANPSITAIVLDINSPGGSTAGIAEIGNAVRDLQAEHEKKIVTFSAGTVGSAAYWIAAACFGLYGTLSSQWGAIGAYRVMLNTSKAVEALGWKVEVYRSGKYKGMGEPGTALTPEQAAFVQEAVDYNGAAFRAHVAEHRPIDATEMEGQYYFAPMAGARGFLDDLVTDLDQVIATLR